MPSSRVRTAGNPYVTDMTKFENAVLIALYQSEVLIGDATISEQDIQDFYSANNNPEKELSDDAKLAIEAKLRKQQLDERKATLRERLREGVTITIEKGVMDPANDTGRADSDNIASVDGQQVSWGEVKSMMQGADQRASVAPFYVDNDEERMKRLQRYIDNTLMASKARAMGMTNPGICQAPPNTARRI